MAFALKLFILVLPLSCWASSANDLAFFKKRQAAFQQWLDREQERNKKADAERNEIREKRQKRDAKSAMAREQFKRVERSNRHLEAGYLKAQEEARESRLVDQEKFARNQKVLQSYKEKYVTPMKPKEYNLEDNNDNVNKP